MQITIPMESANPRTQRGVALLVALVLLIGVSLIGLAGVRTSIAELRMASNAESHTNTVQTALAAIDFVIADTSNLPATGPLNQPVAVTLAGPPFTIAAGNSITATAARTADCAPPPRMRSSSSLTAYSAFNYEIASAVDRNASGMGRSAMAQGYVVLGPKC